MDKIGSNPKPIQTKIINGKEVTNAFQFKKAPGSLKPDYKLALSDKARGLQKDLSKTKDLKPEVAKPNIETPASSESTSVEVKLPNIDVPDIPSPPDITDAADALKKIDNVKEAKKIIEVKKENSIEKPAVFFIGGLRAFDFDLIEDGMKSMTDAVKPARLYSWNQKEEMIDEIKTRKENQPVVLVGHGLGADTAVEIAQELNTLDNRFRRVDMLVTLNSIGFNNDFIPENVLANKNYLTADNGWMDDSANIAINYKTTKVENFLRPESHADLDQSSDIQRQIINEIDRLVY